MRVVILAGGKGSRFGQLTKKTPKALIKIGDQPILIHLMRTFCDQGYTEFIIATGHLHNCFVDFFDTVATTKSCSSDGCEAEWEMLLQGCNIHIRLSYTGVDSSKEGRLIQIRHHLSDDFILSWADALTDISFDNMVASHKSSKKLVTLGLVNPPTKYGHVEVDTIDNKILDFVEKKSIKALWINSGFSVISPQAIDLMKPNGSWEHHLIQEVVNLGLANAFKHGGFWQCMDNTEEREILERYWNTYNCWGEVGHESIIERQ